MALRGGRVSMSALLRLEVNGKSKNISDVVEHVAMVTRSADWEEPMTSATQLVCLT